TPASPPARQTWPPAPEKASARTRANLAAVRIAHTLRATGDTPTAEQRAAMLQYSGWGGLSIEKVQTGWPEGVPLPTSQSLVHEYYTPWAVCADITATVERLLDGIRPIRALEPSAGVGRFIHTTTPERWQWTAIELSPLSALILSQSVPPSTTIATGSFEAWVNVNTAQRFDAIVSNPPYGPRGESITEDKDRRFRVSAAYEYFLLRAMTLLRAGGIAAFLIPGGFLTGTSKRDLRQRIAESADLIGAFRLPSGIFPGARLTLDTVFLARRAEEADPDPVFLDGRYFEAFPAHVLGEVKASGRWGESEVIGDYPGLPPFAPRFAIEAPARTVRITRRPDDEASAPVEAPAEAPAGPIRQRGFRSLYILDQLVTRATAADPYRADAFTGIPAAAWAAAVEDVVQSPRSKGDRLQWLRAVVQTLKTAARKAASQRDVTGQAMLDAARATVEQGIAQIKDRPGPRPLTTLGLPAPLARRLDALPIDDLLAIPTWATLIVERDATADWLPEFERLRIVRVVAVT
ncbi:MAG: N-6 DNA methylase, partial [Sandaracinaceae bacterium]|nr:N-6 DNA methylase [Sandaracinaceae bacterium]